MIPKHHLLDRRHFLHHTASGLGGVALASLLGRDGLLAAEPDWPRLWIFIVAAIGGMGDRVVRMRSGRIMEVIENAERLDPEAIEW